MEFSRRHKKERSHRPINITFRSTSAKAISDLRLYCARETEDFFEVLAGLIGEYLQEKGEYDG